MDSLLSTFTEIFALAVIWLCLLDLPPALWTREVLKLIVARSEFLVKLDQETELLSKGRFARVTLEVNLSHLLVHGANIDIKNEEILNFWQIFEYEHIHSFCRHLVVYSTSRFLEITFPLKMATSSSAAPPKPNCVEVEMAIVDPHPSVANDDIGVLPLPWILVRRCR